MEAQGQIRRIAIVGGDAAAADALWAAIDKRFHQRERIAVLRSPREQADVVVHLEPAAAAAASDGTVLSFVVEAAGAKAIQTHAKAIARAIKSEIPNPQKAPPAAAKKKRPAEPEAKLKKKAAKRPAKAGEPSPEALAAKAARKAEKAKAKAAAKAARRKAPAKPKAAKPDTKKNKKRTTTAPRKPPHPAPAPQALAAKEARKAQKLKAKEAAKAARRPPPTPEALATKEARKAEKAKAKEAAKSSERPQRAPEELAAKELRKLEKARAREAAQSRKKPQPTPEELAAKEARKAGKAREKEGAKTARAVKSAPTPQELAAKQARKAEKAKEKEAAKAARTKKPAPTPEELAAKQARKVEKAREKEAAKAARAKKPAPTPEELAAKEARKTEKAKEKEAAKAARAKKPEPTPEELAAKEARKAEKAREKEAAKAARKTQKPESTPEELAAKEARKAEKAKEKEAAKAARRTPDSELTPEELAAKEARKAAKRERKADASNEAGDDARPWRIAIHGMDEADAAGFRAVMEDALRAAGAEVDSSVPDGRSDIAIYAFDDRPVGEIAQPALTQEKTRLRIFLERVAPLASLQELEETNRAIARLAVQCDGAVLRSPVVLDRFGRDRMTGNGRPNAAGRKLIADAVLRIVAAKLSRRGLSFAPPETASDALQARTVAPLEFLAQLRWSGPAAPKSIWVHHSKEDCEALADSKVVLPGEDAAALGLPLDWSAVPDDRRTEYHVKGLDFLTGPLAYWLAKAGGHSNDTIAGIDAALKARGQTPNLLLARAGQIIVDFLHKHPRAQAPAAWQEGVLTRRARVLLMFVLCCRAALKKKLKINEAACAAATAGLVDSIEILRADDFYAACSDDGVEQDCLLIGLALGLRGTAYGKALLLEGLDRLKRLQLDAGLTADGVWQGDSYATHASVLASLTTLIGDFPSQEAGLAEPLAAVAKKMTVFSEAMLKSNGHPPAIDGSRQRSYAEKLSGMRRTIARSSGKQAAGGKGPLKTRITDTYVFRDAQYFISHTAQSVAPDDSLVVLHAAAPVAAQGNPGGVTLVFAQGESNLLVRAEPAEKVRARQDPSPLFDPALRNFYRVNGEGNAAPVEGSGKVARIVKSWRGPGWAAARAMEDTYANAAIARTAIHLKAQHALIVIDELQTGDGGEAAFEQYWHIAPEFAAPSANLLPLRFASADKGGLSVAMAGEADIQIDTGEAGACLLRRLRMRGGVTAAIFQWTDDAAPLAIALGREGPEGWTVSAAGKGVSAELELAGQELRCTLAEP